MEWKYGLCNCCDNCTNCCLSWFCPCWALGRIADALGQSCCVFCSLGFVALPCLICLERGRIRKKAKIEGGTLSDGAVSFCCPCCGLTQMLNEVEAEDNDAHRVITSQPQGKYYKSLGDKGKKNLAFDDYDPDEIIDESKMERK